MEASRILEVFVQKSWVSRSKFDAVGRILSFKIPFTRVQRTRRPNALIVGAKVCYNVAARDCAKGVHMGKMLLRQIMCDVNIAPLLVFRHSFL